MPLGDSSRLITLTAGDGLWRVLCIVEREEEPGAGGRGRSEREKNILTYL